MDFTIKKTRRPHFKFRIGWFWFLEKQNHFHMNNWTVEDNNSLFCCCCCGFASVRENVGCQKDRERSLKQTFKCSSAQSSIGMAFQIQFEGLQYQNNQIFFSSYIFLEASIIFTCHEYKTTFIEITLYSFHPLYYYFISITFRNRMIKLFTASLIGFQCNILSGKWWFWRTDGNGENSETVIWNRFNSL